MPSGSWNVSALNSYRLVVLEIFGVLTSRIDTDIGGKVTLPFVLLLDSLGLLKLTMLLHACLW